MDLNTNDEVPPIITLFSPNEGGFYNNTAPLFNIEIYDIDLDSMWYSLNNGANYTFITNTTFNSIEWENLPEGQVNITFHANDTLGYEVSKTIHVYKDIHIPIVNITSPMQSQLLGLTAPEFLVEISDLYLDTMWYSLDGGLTNILFTENETFDQSEWNKLNNGSITITFYANDSIGNLVFATVKCWLDGYIPSLSINTPLDNQIFGKNSPYFNVDIDDVNLDKRWYTLNSGPKVFFTNLTGIIMQEAWEACGNGTVVLKFFANDTTGNLAFLETLIFKDVIAPEIIIISPQINYLSGNHSISFNLSINEKNLDSTWYCLNNGINHTIIEMTGIIDQVIWATCGNGSVLIRFYANDTLGNLAYTEVSIRKDIICPDITIIVPIQDGIFGLDAPNFNLLINENNLDQIWYTINHIISNLPCDISGQIDQNFWDLIADGEVQIEFYANDTLGNINSTQVLIYKDASIPNINIISPTPNQLFGSISPDFIVEISGNLDTMWYTINNGMDNFTFSENGTINQAVWDLMPNGTVTINFYVNNTLGKIAFQEVIIRKDIEDPIISIIIPTMNEVFEIPPAYEITITEANLDKTWYSLNGGANITFTGLKGTINQTLWDALPEGNVVLRFYANDSLGRIGFQEITVVKTISQPSPPGIPGYDIMLLIGAFCLILVFIIKRKTLYRINTTIYLSKS
jgi:hypothetical protein